MSHLNNKGFLHFEFTRIGTANNEFDIHQLLSLVPNRTLSE